MERTELNPNFGRIQLQDAAHVLNDVIKPEIYPILKPFDVTYGFSKEPVPWKDRLSLSYKPIQPGVYWSEETYDCAWFHCVVEVPQEYRKKPLWVSFNCEGEALLYDRDGTPLKGFTNGEVGYNHNRDNQTKRNIQINSFMDRNGTIELWFDAGSNNRYWEGERKDEGRFGFCNLCLKNEENEDIYFDVQVFLDLAETIDEDAPIYKPLVDSLSKIRDLYWYGAKDRYELSKKEVAKMMLLPPYKDVEKKRLILVAHSHLDIAWLWPLRENKRKIVRTLTNIYYLMDRYPFLNFIISQPIQMEWIKEASSRLWDRFVAYEKSGRIELQGGAYIEFETNTPGEESLARQMLYGQKYWLETFGHYVDVLWLPDSFGFSGNLPQLMALSKQKYFSTIKVSWSWFTKFPFHDFKWVGIDGSSVLVHSPHENAYNSGSFPGNMYNIDKAKTKGDVFDETLYLYGIGDGGGGPDVGHVERLVRMKKMESMPPMKDGHVEDIFKDLEAVKSTLPSYQGELYLERHQGVLTSQNRHKQWNKHLEERLKIVESYLAAKGIHDFDQDLHAIWKEGLIYQFHDVMAGSSVERVYLEEQVRYQKMEARLDEIMAAVLPAYHHDFQKGDLVYNHLNYPVQFLTKTDDVYYRTQLEPHHFNGVSEAFTGVASANTQAVETPLLRILFNEDGSFKSIYDKKNQEELISAYGGNRFRVFHDYGDAWDIPMSYRDQDEVYMSLVGRSCKRYGKITEISSDYVFSNSKLHERMVIEDDSTLIRFYHDIDWKDTYYILKACFGLAHPSAEATFDIQFGSLKRSTLLKTAEEQGQFEVCAQEWLDVTDEKVGVSLLNHARNGNYVKGDHIEISLLRSTHEPGRFSDQHPTAYSYALYTHRAPFNEAEVDRLAYGYDSEFLYAGKQTLDPIYPVLSNNDIEISAYKNAYQGDGVIVRAYERSGITAETSLSLALPYDSVELTDLLEDPIGPVDLAHLTFKPFEIKTLWFHTKKGTL